MEKTQTHKQIHSLKFCGILTSRRLSLRACKNEQIFDDQTHKLWSRLVNIRPSGHANKLHCVNLRHRFFLIPDGTFAELLEDFDVLEANRQRYMETRQEGAPILLINEKHYIGDEFTMLTRGGLRYYHECQQAGKKMCLTAMRAFPSYSQRRSFAYALRLDGRTICQ